MPNDKSARKTEGSFLSKSPPKDSMYQPNLPSQYSSYIKTNLVTLPAKNCQNSIAFFKNVAILKGRAYRSCSSQLYCSDITSIYKNCFEIIDSFSYNVQFISCFCGLLKLIVMYYSVQTERVIIFLQILNDPCPLCLIPKKVNPIIVRLTQCFNKKHINLI